eukprot:SAG31_NODE_28997_length_402_cov_1.000000_1_plen_98_part_10
MSYLEAYVKAAPFAFSVVGVCAFCVVSPVNTFKFRVRECASRIIEIRKARKLPKMFLTIVLASDRRNAYGLPQRDHVLSVTYCRRVQGGGRRATIIAV